MTSVIFFVTVSILYSFLILSYRRKRNNEKQNWQRSSNMVLIGTYCASSMWNDYLHHSILLTQATQWSNERFIVTKKFTCPLQVKINKNIFSSFQFSYYLFKVSFSFYTFPYLVIIFLLSQEEHHNTEWPNAFIFCQNIHLHFGTPTSQV